MAQKSDNVLTVNLPCGQCGYENEAERVYCHNCGSKLDRSLLPKEEEDKSKKNETPDKARKRIKKMTNPQTGLVAREIKAGLSVLIYSAVLAAILLVIQKPDDVPTPTKELSQRFVSSEMMDLVDSPQPRRVDFTEAEVNAHLRQLLKNKDAGMPLMDFTRAYVNFMPGALRIGTEQSFFGMPIYTGVIYRLDFVNGKFTPTVLGGSFGRLAVHPVAMKHLDSAFQKLWGTLSRERKQMDKLQTVVVQKGTITLVSKGTQ